MTGHFLRYITVDLYTITNFKNETCSSQNDKKLQQNANDRINKYHII